MKKINLICIFLYSHILLAQTAKYDVVIDQFAKDKSFNGVVLVANKGQINCLRSVGIANRQTGTPFTTQSKFKIASITKTFTAVLILKLYEQGRLKLTDVIGNFLPNYKGEGKDSVTIHHLLTYSSGIANEPDKLGMGSYKIPLSLDDYIAKYCSGKLDTTVGSQSNYSNVEYILLGKIIETITKKSFQECLKTEILDPLSMANTGILSSKDIIQDLSETYTYDDTTKVFFRDEPYHIENYFASAAMFSTAEDLLKFNNGLFYHTLLSKKTTDSMLTFYPNLGYVAYGFWGSDGYGNFNEKFYYRPGGILGATANWMHMFNSDKTIIVLSNTNATNLFELSEKLYLSEKGN